MKGISHKPENLKPGQRLPKFCHNELKAEEAIKLQNILTNQKIKNSEELVWYFNAKDGFKTLVDSLYHSLEALTVIESLLPDNEKLREDF